MCVLACRLELKWSQDKSIYKLYCVCVDDVVRLGVELWRGCIEDNFSTRDKWPIPNVSFVRRLYCIPLLPHHTILTLIYLARGQHARKGNHGKTS